MYAGVHCTSYAAAHAMLHELADLDVSTKQVERLTTCIGAERVAERDAAVAAHQGLPLVARTAQPAGVPPPALAVVQADGGRLQIRERTAAAVEPAVAAPSPRGGRYWREDKVAVLATMTGPAHAADPCPTIPAVFVDPAWAQRVTREVTGATGATAADAAGEPAPDPAAAAAYEPPAVDLRTVVASTADAHAFGRQLAAAAWERGFYGAARRAFVADGSATNWGIWERHFGTFEPITDFIHALTYVFAGAMAGRSFAAGWAVYRGWIAAVWAGRVDEVIAGLAERQAELGAPADGEAETSPRVQVAAAVTYLRNQRGRMRYATYRQAGLPITSSHIEATIKQINRRVKGTEKFWTGAGAEAILQLRADYLSETEPMAAFWARRQAAATGERRYSNAA